ncbi:unnamed protein product [Symbiodinium natans]|uniref:Pentatricopeptide repeat-containing protein n=1 Tax=Symbiodinium natans TaxID=878477 RepID=A0A812MBD6_9DINO|nr:unnamed protein product [Symbiodinium natans]
MALQCCNADQAAHAGPQLSLKLQAWRRNPRGALRSLSAGWVEASQILQLLLAASIQTNVYHFNAVLGAVARAKRWPRALQMLRSMRNHPETAADVVSLNAAIHAGEKGRLWQVAHALLQLLQELGGVPSSISYNSCISACSGRAWPHAVALANAMVSGNAAPDVITCNAVGSACSVVDWRRSAAYLSRLHAAVVLPDVISHNTVANSLESSRWSWALGNLPRMRQSALRPSSVSFGTLMKLCEDLRLAKPWQEC